MIASDGFTATTFTRADATGPGRIITTSGFTPTGARRWRVSFTLALSANEQRERLEQLRALDAGMRIDAAIVKGVPARRRYA